MATDALQSCEPRCGRYTDPTSLASFDVSALCGRVMRSRDHDESWTVNVCGSVPCASSPGFCVFADLSVCGVDGENGNAGMVLRTNYSEPCGSSGFACPRCIVAASSETRRGVWTWALLDGKSPAQGVQATLPIVPLTGAQLKQHDPNGFCTGGNGRVSTLRFLCDCTVVDEPVLERVWTDADASCTLFFDIRSAQSCYFGFCDGQVPPAFNADAGAEVSWFLWIFFFLGSAFLLRQAWLRRGAQWMGMGDAARGPRPASSVYSESSPAQASPHADEPLSKSETAALL